MGRSVGLLPWFGNTVFGETVWGAPDVSCADVGVSSWIPVSLERTVCSQVGPLDPVNESSKHFFHCTLSPWALVSVPALVFG